MEPLIAQISLHHPPSSQVKRTHAMMLLTEWPLTTLHSPPWNAVNVPVGLCSQMVVAGHRLPSYANLNQCHSRNTQTVSLSLCTKHTLLVRSLFQHLLQESPREEMQFPQSPLSEQHSHIVKSCPKEGGELSLTVPTLQNTAVIRRVQGLLCFALMEQRRLQALNGGSNHKV